MNTGTIPVVAEPDQRYWRRRANRRVRKARLTRSLRRWSAVAVALGIIGTALFQVGSHAVDRIKSRGGFAVEYIEVEGAVRGGAGSIRERLAPFVGQNIVDLNLFKVAAVAASDPWVLSASAKRVLPATLHVTVAERHPAAVAVIDGAAYVVDTTGYVVGPLQHGVFGHLPVLTGLDGFDRDSLAAALVSGVRAIARLRESAGTWVGEIAEMDLSRRDRIEVRTVDPGPVILLDPGRVERNLNRYLELRREIAGRAGRLEYVDLRWQDRIAVMPVAQAIP
jgi:cell division septal protein FtsQ